MENLLSHNSETMATIVETFVIEETAELIYDGEALENWNNLVSELGLKGQTEIVKPEKSPIPFMHLKTGLANVLTTLCPCAVRVELYNKTPIPVEILKLIALAKTENYFEAIEVWYDDQSPDPCVIGLNYAYYSTIDGRWDKRFSNKSDAEKYMIDNGYSGSPFRVFDAEKYLIGKWADVKQSFDELKERAYKRYIEEQSASLRKSIIDYQRQIDDLESNAVLRFN